MVSVPLKLNLLIICGQCLGGVFGFVWSTIAYFSFGHPLSFKWGNTSGQQIATLSEGVARLFCRMPAVRSRDIGFLWIWDSERRKQSRCPIPEIQDSDDYEAVVQAADSQQATNHSLSSRSQKRLRAYHLLKLPQANFVTWFMPGIYDLKNGRKHT